MASSSILVLYYPRCTTCKRALSWLQEHNVDYKGRDIVLEHPTAAELKTWHRASGLPLRRFFNTSGIRYREMNLKDKLPNMDEEACFELLSTDGKLVKRPIVVVQKEDGSIGQVLVGFREAEWQEKLL